MLSGSCPQSWWHSYWYSPWPMTGYLRLELSLAKRRVGPAPEARVAAPMAAVCFRKARRFIASSCGWPSSSKGLVPSSTGAAPPPAGPAHRSDGECEGSPQRRRDRRGYAEKDNRNKSLRSLSVHHPLRGYPVSAVRTRRTPPTPFQLSFSYSYATL